MLKKYRLKPKEVKAIQYKGGEPCNDIRSLSSNMTLYKACLDIKTDDGILKVYPDYWIIQNKNGKFETLPPNIFNDLYKEAKKNEQK